MNYRLCCNNFLIFLIINFIRNNSYIFSDTYWIIYVILPNIFTFVINGLDICTFNKKCIFIDMMLFDFYI